MPLPSAQCYHRRHTREEFLDVGFESKTDDGTQTSHRSGMVARLYLGNLPFTISEEEVRELFEQYGTVHSVRLVDDQHTGRPRGFGFVEMDDGEAEAATEALHGKYFAGRILRVERAK